MKTIVIARSLVALDARQRRQRLASAGPSSRSAPTRHRRRRASRRATPASRRRHLSVHGAAARPRARRRQRDARARAARSAASATSRSACARTCSTATLPQVDKFPVQRRTARRRTNAAEQATSPRPADGRRRDRHLQGLPLGADERRRHRCARERDVHAERSTRIDDVDHAGRQLQVRLRRARRLLSESIVVPGVSCHVPQARSADDDIIGTDNVGADDAEHRRRQGEDDGVARRRRARASSCSASRPASVRTGTTSRRHRVTVTDVDGGIAERADRAADISQTLTRTNYFVDLSLNLPLVQARRRGRPGVAAVTSSHTYNTFSDGRADDSRIYGSLGLRFGF